MDRNVQKFLNSNKVSALTVQLADGTLHASAMHYSHWEEPFRLYFSTSNTSRKCQGLLSGEVVPAAVVIGITEADWQTMQLDGSIRVVKPKDIPGMQEAHYAKHPNSAKFKDDPATIFLEFTPEWWRYTNYNVQPPVVTASE